MQFVVRLGAQLTLMNGRPESVTSATVPLPRAVAGCSSEMVRFALA